jgi:hypothetical protein
VLAGLLAFGDRHLMAGKPPLLWRHRNCGGRMTDRRTCARCGAELQRADVEPQAGPGATARTRARLARA